MTEFDGREWHFYHADDEERAAFPSLGDALSLHGEIINDNLMSSLLRVCRAGRIYYVKRYKKRGKQLRRLIGRSRVRAEWENLIRLENFGVPTVRLVAYGEQQKPGSRQGVLIVEEIPGARDLASLADAGASELADAAWVDHVADRLATSVAAMHQHCFVHNDLKWRNILVDEGAKPGIYVIDCPTGREIESHLLRTALDRGIVKDLACLDKVARSALTKSQRLRFYLRYAGLVKLDPAAKRRLTRVLTFFDGRE